MNSFRFNCIALHMIDCRYRHLLHSPSKGSAAKSIQRMVDSGFCSWKLRTCMHPVPATLLSLHMYPPCANKPSPAAMCSRLLSPFWRQMTGNRKEGTSAHVFRKRKWWRH